MPCWSTASASEPHPEERPLSETFGPSVRRSAVPLSRDTRRRSRRALSLMMTAEAWIKVATFAAGYLLFLWALTWPLRHASWLQSHRFEADRRQARWQSHFGGR